MPINYQFTMALKALREVQAELDQEPRQEQLLFPEVPDILAELDPLPANSLLFGVAADGLPLLLNLRDAATGPLLIVADQRGGKTSFLHFLARAATRLLKSDAVRYAVLTAYPDEWRVFEKTAYCLEIASVHDQAALELLYELACRAEAGGKGPALLLLFDGLDWAPRLDATGQQNLRYLLECGPQAGVWPIVTVNAARAPELPDWMVMFHTRIFGRILQPGAAAELANQADAGLNTLVRGAEFCLRQKSHWLRFWLPSL